MRKVIISHPTANSFVRALAEGLLAAGYLQRLYTTVAYFPGSILYRLGKFELLKDIRRRGFKNSLQPFTTTHPAQEIGRLLASKAGLYPLIQQEKGFLSIDSVYSAFDKFVAVDIIPYLQQDTKAVYCYEDGAMHTFEAAKQYGIACLYDLPIGYWRTMHRMLEIEKELHPEWAATITGFYDSPKKLEQKDKELALADRVFVSSSFVARTLQDYPGTIKNLSIIPYGFPEIVASKNYSPLCNRPLKLLFVGSLSQRKGLANLFEAIAPFGNKVTLTIVGEKVIKNCKPLNIALTRHRWIRSLPQQDILLLMQQHDVFIFPSLFEGFGMVITEAMSQGTPVITTERTAGPDIIQHGENGWLTEAGNTESLKTTIAGILENPEMIKRLGKAAIETAVKRPWRIYGNELTNII